MSKEPEMLKSELHHWWPKSLSEYWKDSEGQVYCTRANGKELRGPPKNFGAISNAHHIFREGDWQSTVEPAFSSADSNFPHLIEKLYDAETMFSYIEKEGIRYADLDVNTTNSIEENIYECVASLIVRSPQFRNIAKVTVEYYGLHGDRISNKHHIIASNIANSYRMAIGAIASSGLKFVCFSKDNEFVYGDGHFNNVPLTSHFGRGVNCAVPLTPRIAFISFNPSGAYRSGMRLVKLDNSHVDEFNFATQLYSSDFLFSRSQPPELSEEYRSNEHLHYQYHDFEFIKKISKPFIWEQFR